MKSIRKRRRSLRPELRAPRLGRITLGGDRVFFGGVPGRLPPAAPEFPPETRRLRIDLAPLSSRAGFRYLDHFKLLNDTRGHPEGDLRLQEVAHYLGHITASFGVAAIVPASDQAADALVDAADHALYRAKTEGRNRVATAPFAGG